MNNFNPRAPCGARLGQSEIFAATAEFQSARPVRGATIKSGTHALNHQFQSARPVRGATLYRYLRSAPVQISIRAPRAGRDQVRPESLQCGDRISIRAPRAGRDLSQNTYRRYWIHFNPRAPCGARRMLIKVGLYIVQFQSARPVRGATCLKHIPATSAGISIRAPRAGRDPGQDFLRRTGRISIRAPRAGRDFKLTDIDYSGVGFQSARPVRGATAQRRQGVPIVALFQSARPVRGATIPAAVNAHRNLIFQSARPVRGATLRL